MTWKHIDRNEGGRIEWYVAVELENLECNRVVFWNSDYDIAEMLPCEMLLTIDNCQAYTHYCILSAPKVDRRRSERKNNTKKNNDQ